MRRIGERASKIPYHLILTMATLSICPARSFRVLMVLFAHAFRGNSITKPEEEEMTILVYAQEIAPPYEAINEKKALDANPVGLSYPPSS